MRCPRCGKGVSDHDAYCPVCGERLASDEAVLQSNKPLLIAMIAIVLALLVVTFLAFTGKLGPHDDEPEPVAEATVTPEQAEPTLTPQPTSPPEPTPSPSPSPTPATGGTYILPDSDSRMLTEADLENLGERELMLARNEIFARHGRIFKTPEIAAYFESKDWYDGRYSEVTLSSLETQNVNFIIAYENKHFGGSYY